MINFKTGVKLAVLLALGLLLTVSLTLLFYKSYKSLHQEPTTSNPVKNSASQGDANAEEMLASLLGQDSHNFITGSRDTNGYLQVTVDGRLWRKLPTKEKKSYLQALSSARTALGRTPDVKIIDSKTSIELASLEHGRLILGADQDES